MRRWTSRLAGVCVGVLLSIGTLLLAYESVRYLSFDPHFTFLLERVALTSHDVWRSAFYVHVAGSLACLATAPFLLVHGLSGGGRPLHRAVGRVHSIAALGWVAPTAFYLAVHAKGGFSAQLGFFVIAALFTVATLAGVRAIRRSELVRHVVFMVRSYALLSSAIWFRMILPALHALGVEHEPAYVIATWASLLLSIGVGEFASQRFVAARRRVHSLPEVVPCDP